ncbi:MAG: polysaccharide pyruvyl transferase family protein [Aphanothece saxicola GSE-SYN-MK-01-06B]|jgi:hypothetical protein|nr:polysaccharide pyruvyl transferase family protein [Aphanothece saxicola GSE-SYN-MK-01-06B]
MSFDAILFGAFERHNFGDLLMGFVFTKLLEMKGISCIHASILNNDLSSFSGTRVYSIFDLMDAGLDTSTPILHVGGETASCSFNDALGCDSPLPLPYHQKDEVCTKLQQLLGTDRPFPYLTPPHETVHGQTSCWPNRLFYGVGFTSPSPNNEKRNLLAKTFTGSRMSGFRDDYSLDNARELGIRDIIFAPDIVLYISKLMSLTSTEQSGYLLVHYNQEYLRRNEASLIEELSQVRTSFRGGIKIGLAGTAHYHDSLNALYRFKEMAAKSSVSIEVLPCVDIFSICKQIANAAVVASTSLHYRIIARSYGVPRLSMQSHKVDCWAKSNDDIYPFGLIPKKLASTIESLIDMRSHKEEVGQERDIATIEESLETISDIIHSLQPRPNSMNLDLLSARPQAPSPDLWIAAMAQCLDESRSTGEERGLLLKQKEACLSSRRFLVKRLLQLMRPPFAR